MVTGNHGREEASTLLCERFFSFHVSILGSMGDTFGYAGSVDRLTNPYVALFVFGQMKRAYSQIHGGPTMEHQALSQITPTEARTLLSFMQAHIPAPKRLNPAMTWEESHHIDRLFDKVRAVLSCRADKEVGK
ncbi:hypothetical protein [uncultured Desulfobacter sp.]|uniref:hypothetical protein n=1 Tax=uncultured Desulfobacter sp. TaxID=240139 RepID=UPI002AAA9D1F|nr:hypothetical protein [uncultured Desulfobacter sp.]